MRQTNRLTSVKIDKLKVAGLYPDGGGLYLQVTLGADDKPRKSWLFRYATGAVETSRTGKPRRAERRMGLGSLDDITLAQAREKAADARKERRRGVDPIQVRRDQRASVALATAKAMTFDQCRDAYIKAHQAGWRNLKHAAQWTSTLDTYASPVIGKLPVAAIDVGLVTKILEQDDLWTRKPETAGRVRGRIEAVLDWAAARGYRTGENPARWRGHLDKLLPRRSKVQKVKHHPALPYRELPAFLTALRKQKGVAARALEFTILTAARTNEVIGAHWDEIDLSAKVWRVPEERMKAHREHRVPLSARALAILTELPRDSSRWLFIGNGAGGRLSRTRGMLGALNKINQHVTVHGFRSSFRDWAAESTNFPREIAEAALAHIVGDETERAYQRGDLFEKRRKLMDAWVAFCAKAPANANVVVPLRGKLARTPVEA